MLGENVLGYIKTDTLIIQPAYDAYQIPVILGLDCINYDRGTYTIVNCNAKDI